MMTIMTKPVTKTTKPKISILLETPDFLVINKPAGLVVHGDGKHKEPTVVDWFLKKYPESEGVGEAMEIEHAGETIEIPRSGIVHRLDRDTSGVLILAKNQDTFDFFKKQFQAHTIKKKYVAIVFGWPRDERGIIEQPIGRSRSDIRAWTTKSSARGTMRDAITRFTVKKKFEYDDPASSAGKQKYALVDLYPQTGRTHQLRVHMAHMGHPIVGDPIYSGKKTTTLPIERTALHAEQVTFKNPNGKDSIVIAPMPADLTRCI
jgi:23S rRNA pseudouridine1911/1915/1917 synthase